MWISLLLVICVCISDVFGSHGVDSTYCSTPTAPPGVQNIPKPNISSQFSVHVECVIRNKNMTTDIHEWYDDLNNRGAVRQLEDGYQLNAWYDYNSNEFIAYEPTAKTCLVQSLSTSDQRYLFGDTTVAGSNKIFSPSKALRFKTSAPEIYMGVTTVRGILVDTWKSCQYWDAFDATMTVTWYFTAAGYEWDSAVGISIPVRAHVVGKVYDDNTNFHMIDHYYDFYHFRPQLDDPTIFETPAGVQCPGRKNTKSLPLTANAFSFTTEIIDKFNQRISFMTELYDFKTKVVMYKYRPSQFANSPYGTNDLIEIHDFNTGVAYITDKMYGNCSVKPIEQGSFDDKSVNNPNQLRMRTTREFFYFDVIKFTYEGVKKTRNIDCDTWVGIRPNWPAGTQGNSTWQWYFATNDWQEVNTGALQGGTPVQMRVDAPLAGWSYEYNVYNFVKSQPNILTFDISHCYMNRNRRKFQVNFPGDYKPNIAKDIEEFKYFLLLSLTNQLKISPLRIANIGVYLESDIICTFEILDVAPLQGDVQNPIKEVPLSVAADKFMNLINTNKFIVATLGSSFQNLVGLVPKKNSLTETTYLKQTGSQTGSITPGAMAAVGVVMPVVGGALGGVFAFFFFKK